MLDPVDMPHDQDHREYCHYEQPETNPRVQTQMPTQAIRIWNSSGDAGSFLSAIGGPRNTTWLMMENRGFSWDLFFHNAPCCNLSRCHCCFTFRCRVFPCEGTCTDRAYCLREGASSDLGSCSRSQMPREYASPGTNCTPRYLSHSRNCSPASSTCVVSDRSATILDFGCERATSERAASIYS